MDCVRVIFFNYLCILMIIWVNNIYFLDIFILVFGLFGNEYFELVCLNCKRLYISDFNEKKVSKFE